MRGAAKKRKLKRVEDFKGGKTREGKRGKKIHKRRNLGNGVGHMGKLTFSG